jgi:hypothetical protein
MTKLETTMKIYTASHDADGSPSTKNIPDHAKDILNKYFAAEKLMNNCELSTTPRREDVTDEMRAEYTVLYDEFVAAWKALDAAIGWSKWDARTKWQKTKPTPNKPRVYEVKREL